MRYIGGEAEGTAVEQFVVQGAQTETIIEMVGPVVVEPPHVGSLKSH